MGDYIKSVTVKVYIQENGIMRIDETGEYIGRLDGVSFEKVEQFAEKDE